MYFPASLFLVVILGLLTIFTDDSIKYTILHKSEPEALAVISKFYVAVSKDEQLAIFHHLKQNSS